MVLCCGILHIKVPTGHLSRSRGEDDRLAAGSFHVDNGCRRTSAPCGNGPLILAAGRSWTANPATSSTFGNECLATNAPCGSGHLILPAVEERSPSSPPRDPLPPWCTPSAWMVHLLRFFPACTSTQSFIRHSTGPCITWCMEGASGGAWGAI